LTVLPSDVPGAIGCGFLVAVLLSTRIPVYAGVFVAVAVLELYGTWIGTWRWQAVVPGLGLSQGNPPSGVASGYVMFDICALLLTAQLMRIVRSRRRQSMRPRTAEA
jgi:ABC-type multidrug transport system permease subunit